MRFLWSLWLGLASCTYFTGDDHVLVTSTPPGARILVDDAPTGLTTPARIQLGGMFGSDHEVALEKRGYTTEKRKVYHHTTTYTSVWIDGAADEVLWTLPFYWTIGDFMTPFAVRWRYVPHELHVRLHREGTAPVEAPK